MIDKKEPLFITMMEYHSRKRSICNKTGPIVSLNDLPSLARNNTLFFQVKASFSFPLLKCDRNKRTYLHYVCPLWTFHLLTSSLAFFFFLSFLLLLWMFLRRLTDRRLPGFLPTFFPFTQRHESAVGLPFHQPSKTHCSRQSETDRQTGTVAERDDDYNDVRLSVGGLTPLTTCQQRWPTCHQVEAGRTFLCCSE